MDDNQKNVLEIAKIFDALGFDWFLGGSLASALYGVPRATLDADLVARIRKPDVPDLIAALGEDWYVSEEAVAAAIESCGSFNLINLDTALKIDVFIPKRRRFEKSQFARTRMASFSETDPSRIPVCSPEDIVIAKLDWYRLGGEISERQWSDVVGVLRFGGQSLEKDVMSANADELGLEDLLEKAILEAANWSLGDLSE